MFLSWGRAVFIYANTVGDFGAVSAGGGNWGRLLSAVRRWALELVGDNDIPILLPPRDALVLAESAIFDETSIVVIFF